MFRYAITIESLTDQPIKYSIFSAYYTDNDDAKQDLFNQLQENLGSSIVQAFADQGETVNVVEANITDIQLVVVGVVSGQGYIKLRLFANAVIETESNYFNSPIAPWVIIAIGVAIGLVVAAVTVPEAISSWLTSMTTKTTTVKQYDADGNLLSEETTTEPDEEGMWNVAIIFVVLVVVLVVVSMLKNRHSG